MATRSSGFRPANVPAGTATFSYAASCLEDARAFALAPDMPARPKASVRDEGGFLCIAKFPKADESAVDDACAWEHAALRLMERSGIPVPVSRLLRVAGRSVLLTRRFDRRGHGRVPYISR